MEKKQEVEKELLRIEEAIDQLHKKTIENHSCPELVQIYQFELSRFQTQLQALQIRILLQLA